MLHDLLAGRLRRLGEEFRRLHDLAGLAVTALGHLVPNPRLLEGVRRIGGQSLDRRDVLARGFGRQRLAGAQRLAVDVNGAGAAKACAAAVFGAREADLVADHPQKRRIGLGVHRHGAPVQIE